MVIFTNILMEIMKNVISYGLSKSHQQSIKLLKVIFTNKLMSFTDHCVDIFELLEITKFKVI